MEYSEISIKVKSEFSQTVEAIANMAVPYGIYVEDYSDIEEQAWEIAHIDLIDEELLSKDRNTVIVHLYLEEDMNPSEICAFLEERLKCENIEYELDTTKVSDAQWKDNWKKHFHVTDIGERLVIRPSWEEYNNQTNRKILSIDPGAAFGTGTHATTKMCLSALDKYVEDGTTLLDIGCGSGILAIAGVLLGGKGAVGVDIDSVAVKVAKENAEINGVNEKTEFIVGDLAEKVTGKFDVVCANIVADIIIILLENVHKYMNEDSLFICSGIIDMRQSDVEKAFLKYGFEIVEALKEDNWRAFVCRKIWG